jgi:hypothetical protein
MVVLACLLIGQPELALFFLVAAIVMPFFDRRG